MALAVGGLTRAGLGERGGSRISQHNGYRAGAVAVRPGR